MRTAISGYFTTLLCRHTYGHAHRSTSHPYRGEVIRTTMMVTTSCRVSGTGLGTISVSGSQGATRYYSNSSVIGVHTTTGVVTLRRPLNYAVRALFHSLNRQPSHHHYHYRQYALIFPPAQKWRTTQLRYLFTSPSPEDRSRKKCRTRTAAPEDDSRTKCRTFSFFCTR